MPVPEPEVDASFFNLIYQLTSVPPAATDAERRQFPRQPFASVQWIAVRHGPGVPPEGEFFEVQCHDLTRQGFSFLLPGRPHFDAVVAALGTPPDVIYMAADVTRSTDVLVSGSGRLEPVGPAAGRRERKAPPDPAAVRMVLVGCRFVQRLHRD
jgi:hypothetical protein